MKTINQLMSENKNLRDAINLMFEEINAGRVTGAIEKFNYFRNKIEDNYSLREKIIQLITMSTFKEKLTEKERCENCKFYNGWYKCLFNAPILTRDTHNAKSVGQVGDENGNYITHIAEFAPVSTFDWCGQWKEKAKS